MTVWSRSRIWIYVALAVAQRPEVAQMTVTADPDRWALRQAFCGGRGGQPLVNFILLPDIGMGQTIICGLGIRTIQFFALKFRPEKVTGRCNKKTYSCNLMAIHENGTRDH